MPDAAPKPPPFEPDTAKYKAPPLPDAPVLMPGQHMASPPSFSDAEYDEARKKRVEDAKGFDEIKDVDRAVKVSEAAVLEHQLDYAKKQKKLDAAFAMDRVERGQAKKVEMAQAIDQNRPKPSQQVVTSEQPKETKPSQPAAENPPPPKPAPQPEPAATPDKPAAQQVDLSEVMRELKEQRALIESLPRLLSMFGRLS